MCEGYLRTCAGLGVERRVTDICARLDRIQRQRVHLHVAAYSELSFRYGPFASEAVSLASNS